MRDAGCGMRVNEIRRALRTDGFKSDGKVEKYMRHKQLGNIGEVASS